MVKHTQIIRRLLPTNFLSVFYNFVGLALKRSNERSCHRYTRPALNVTSNVLTNFILFGLILVLFSRKISFSTIRMVGLFH